MRVISSRSHGYIDYGTGLLLLVAPYLLGFADGTAAQWVPMIVGLTILGMSLMTDYELSVAKLVPLPVHLGADVLAGILLAAFSMAFWLRWSGVLAAPHRGNS